MVATAIYSVAMVVWKETSFSLWTAMERRWKNQDVDVDGKHVRRKIASMPVSQYNLFQTTID